MKRLERILIVFTVLAVCFCPLMNCRADAQYGGNYSKRETSYTISTNTTYCDSFGSSFGEERWYKFNLKNDGYIVLDFQHDYEDSTLYFCDMYIYNTADTDSYIFHWYTTGKDVSYQSGNIGLKAGTYYLKIKASSAAYNKKFYTTVYYYMSDRWEKEFNDSPQTANRITAGASCYGAIQAGPAQDWYVFNINRYNGTDITLEHEYIDSFLPYWSVTVYDSRVQKIKSFTVSGKDLQTTQRLDLEPGTYYIKIDEAQCWSDIDYKLSVY